MRTSVLSKVVAVLAGGLLVSTTTPAFADNVQDTLVTGSSYSFVEGGSSSVNYSLVSNGSDGCNVDLAHPATVTVAPPAGLTAVPLFVQLTACGSGGAQSIEFSSSTAGSYDVEPSASGGKTGNNGYNTAPAKATFTVTVPTDSTPPVVTPTVTGTAGSSGWFTSNVEVSWSVTDAQSAISSTSGCGPASITAETAGVTVTCSATSAGGTTTASQTIKVDKTGPSAALAPSGTLGANGWYVSNVNVTTAGTDAVSGLASCTAPQAFTTETAGTTVNGSCTNQAGLSTAAVPLTLKLDKTAPTNVVSAVTAGTAGTGGWYTSDVTVSTTSDADLSSPVVCTVPQALTNNTGGTAVHGTCTNNAGLAADSSPINVKIDKSGPSAALSASGALGDNDWYTSDVTISTSGDDADSGATCTADQFQTTDTNSSGQDFNGSCTNGAGTTTNAELLNIKRDASLPTAQLVVTAGTAGSNGWYTSAVTVQVQGTDDDSGVTCTGGGSVATDTAGVTFTGYCVNGAGLRTDAVDLPVKLDTTGPSAGLAVTAGSEGDNGWYTTDMTVSTSGTDGVSGPVGCTADQFQTSETAGQEFNGTCTNDAGLHTDALPLTVMLDKTGPTNVASAVTSGTGGSNDWYTSDVTVTTTGDEDVSSPAACSAPLTLQDETTGTDAAGSCTNAAGLSSDAPSLTVKIDKTGPVVTLTPTGTAGTNGWFVGDVTLTATGTDSISEPVTCDAPQSLTTETSGASFLGSCTNDAGLSASDNVSVKLDKSGPDVTVTPTGTPGANGWFIDDVTVTTMGVDGTSGPVTCDGPQTQTAETSGTGFAGVCTNDAGLVGSGSTTVMLDKTAPLVTVTPTGTAGSNGWFIGDVTLTTTGTDSISGPTTCDGPQSQTAETGFAMFTGNCTNLAGIIGTNTATVKLDKSGPVVTVTPTGGLGLNGWYVGNVTAATAGTDSISEPVICDGPQSQTVETIGFTFTGECTNDAGIGGSNTATVKLDKTAPVVTVTPAGTLGLNGWYVSAVTLTTSGVEAIATPITCDADQSQLTDTAGTTFNGSCTNDAGQVGLGSASVKVDRIAPTAVAFDGGPANGASYLHNFAPVAPTCTANGGTSGLAACLVTGYSTAVGSHTMTATATDNAGNTATATSSYTVYSLTLGGFFAPVDMNGVLNTVKNGSTVPLKFRAYDLGVERTDIAVVAGFSALPYNCTTGVEDAIEELATTGGTTLRYDATGHQFIQNWKTPAKAGTCYVAKVTFVDGSSLSAKFKLK